MTTTCLRRRRVQPPEDLLQDLMHLGLWMENPATVYVARAGRLIHESHQYRQAHGRSRTLALADALYIALGEQLSRPVVAADRLWKDMEDRFTVPVHQVPA